MGRRKAALEPIGGKKEVAFADFKAILGECSQDFLINRIKQACVDLRSDLI